MPSPQQARMRDAPTARRETAETAQAPSRLSAAGLKQVRDQLVAAIIFVIASPVLVPLWFGIRLGARTRGRENEVLAFGERRGDDGKRIRLAILAIPDDRSTWQLRLVNFIADFIPLLQFPMLWSVMYGEASLSTASRQARLLQKRRRRARLTPDQQLARLFDEVGIKGTPQAVVDRDWQGFQGASEDEATHLSRLRGLQDLCSLIEAADAGADRRPPDDHQRQWLPEFTASQVREYLSLEPTIKQMYQRAQRRDREGRMFDQAAQVQSRGERYRRRFGARQRASHGRSRRRIGSRRIPAGRSSPGSDDPGGGDPDPPALALRGAYDLVVPAGGAA
jgi:hypothetical protein